LLIIYYFSSSNQQALRAPADGFRFISNHTTPLVKRDRNKEMKKVKPVVTTLGKTPY